MGCLCNDSWIDKPVEIEDLKSVPEYWTDKDELNRLSTIWVENEFWVVVPDRFKTSSRTNRRWKAPLFLFSIFFTFSVSDNFIPARYIFKKIIATSTYFAGELCIGKKKRCVGSKTRFGAWCTNQRCQNNLSLQEVCARRIDNAGCHNYPHLYSGGTLGFVGWCFGDDIDNSGHRIPSIQSSLRFTPSTSIRSIQTVGAVAKYLSQTAPRHQ